MLYLIIQFELIWYRFFFSITLPYLCVSNYNSYLLISKRCIYLKELKKDICSSPYLFQMNTIYIYIWHYLVRGLQFCGIFNLFEVKSYRERGRGLPFAELSSVQQINSFFKNWFHFKGRGTERYRVTDVGRYHMGYVRDWKWSHWDPNTVPQAMSVPEVETEPTVPQHWPSTS